MTKTKQEKRRTTVEIEKEVAVKLKSFCKERGLKIKWWVNRSIRKLIGMGY